MKVVNFKAQNFTCFEDVSITFSQGINVFVGENGVGKTHVLKAVYAMCYCSRMGEQTPLDVKMGNVFRPNSLGRLVRRKKGRGKGSVECEIRGNGDGKSKKVRCTVTSLGKAEVSLDAKGVHNAAVTYIPVKDMLANAPNFRSMYKERDIRFEEVYADILDKALLPPLKGQPSADTKRLLDLIHQAIDGRVISKQEMFYLKNSNGELEFPLLAEGMRKVGLLYTLIANGTLSENNVLLWDEPEANLNPKMIRNVAKIMLALSKMGVQLFVCTHSYFLLKELCLQRKDEEITFHSLYKNDTGAVVCSSTDDYESMSPNAIDEVLDEFLDSEISMSLKNLQL